MSRVIFVSSLVFLVSFLVVSLLVEDSSAFLVFLGNTTACDTCDEYLTYSGRNVLCCLAQSKCCGPNSFDEIETKPAA